MAKSIIKLENVNKTYQNPGQYSVLLKAKDSTGIETSVWDE